MQPLAIVILLDKLLHMATQVLQIAILGAGHLFLLERFHESLTGRICRKDWTAGSCSGSDRAPAVGRHTLRPHTGRHDRSDAPVRAAADASRWPAAKPLQSASPSDSGPPTRPQRSANNGLTQSPSKRTRPAGGCR